MNRETLLPEMRACLSEAYGDRFRGVVLFGSEARGTSTDESDIDLLVLLEGPAESWADIKLTTDALYPLMLRIGRTIDAHPVDVHRYEEAEAPLYVAARREGIRA